MRCTIIALLFCAGAALGQELSTFYAAEVYNQTGEVKGGFGIRGRYWWDRFGVEAHGLSLTPKDSIVDRSDLSVCWRYEFAAPEIPWGIGDDRGRVRLPVSSGAALIFSAGIGSNWEDHAWGPGAGAALQYQRGRIGAELGARLIQEDHSKTLLTAGITIKL